tara:strand:- start:232 stop:366 length:135 start_codon:yes stop_codon:yes gene_type:complete
MPKVNGKHYAYTAKGIAKAQAAAKKKGKKVTMKKKTVRKATKKK